MSYIKQEPKAFGAVLLVLHNMYASDMADVCPGDTCNAGSGNEPNETGYLSMYLSHMEDKFFAYLKEKYNDDSELVGCFVDVDMFVHELHELGFTSDDAFYAGYLARKFYKELYPCDMNFSINDIVDIISTEV